MTQADASLNRAIRNYRIMAFTTGTLLAVACIALFQAGTSQTELIITRHS